MLEYKNFLLCDILIFNLKLKDGIIQLKYDPKIFKASYEMRILNGPEDGIILQRWGDNIYMIQLSNLRKMKSGEFLLIISY